MGANTKSKLTAEKIAQLSFFKRFKYKILDVLKPEIDPKLVMFSKMEKQVLFLVLLSIFVGFTIFLVLEYGFVLGGGE